MLSIGEGPIDGIGGEPEIGTTFIAMNTLPHFSQGVARGIEDACTGYEVGVGSDEQA